MGWGGGGGGQGVKEEKSCQNGDLGAQKSGIPDCSCGVGGGGGCWLGDF